jgi:hypothetical protein
MKDTYRYLIKQISVFSENKPGRLAAIARALQEEQINILAFSIAEADGFGVVRALVDKPQKAYEIAKILGDGGINIEYSYAYSGKDAAVLILRVDSIEAAVTLLREGGGELLESSVFH